MTALDDLVDAFLAEEFADSPVLATMKGVPGHDDALPDLTAAGYADRARREDGWLERFRALASDQLAPDEAIDRDLAVSALRGRQVMREWADERRNPDTYTGPGLYGVFGLFVHGLRPPAELAADAAARLRAVPELLDAGRAHLDPELASPLLVRRALGQARGAVSFCRDTVPTLADSSDLAAAGEVAGSAYAGFADWLEGFEERAHGDFAIGEERYSALLREREGLPYGLDGLREGGRAAYDELAADLARRARDLGSEDWRALLAELDADHPATPEEMRSGYEAETRRAREFCLERELVSLPAGEECVVEPSPEFQRSILAVASYLAPPPFTDSRTGHFFVPFPPAGASAAEVQQRLSTNAWSSIPTVSVHEAWPGHHWHLSWLAHVGVRPLRRVLTTPYFSEGWALYAEDVLRSEGYFSDPRAELRQVDARIFRATRIVVDTSLHDGSMTVEEAVSVMTTRAALSEGTARAEVARYCAWPTQAASYLTGALEIARMRAAWTGPVRDFHDQLAGSGALPLRLAERALLG